MAKRVVNVIGSGGPLLSAGVARRDWGRAVVLTALIFAVVSLFVLMLLWRDLPGLPRLQAPLVAHVKGLLAFGIHGAIPSLFPDAAAEMRRYLATLHGSGLSHLLYWRLLLASAAGAAVGYLVFKDALVPTDGIQHDRGRRKVEGEAATKAANAAFANKIKHGGKDLFIHPKIMYPSDNWQKHVLVIGAIGGGKTTVISPILRQIEQRDDKALIFDVKGDFTERFQRATLVAPWHKKGTPWAIGRDCRSLQDAIAFAEQCVAESKDPMWGKAARQVLVGLIVDLQRRMPGRWGWKDLNDQFSRTGEEEIQLIMSQCNPQGLLAVTGAQQTASGILINMVAGLQWVASLAEAWGNPKEGEGISFIDWLKDDDSKIRQIILQGNGRFEAMVKGYVSAIVAMLSARINSPEIGESRTRRLWFIFDEFPQMGAVPYQSLVETGRSKDVRCVFGFQDLNQLVKVYGSEDANALFSMVGTKIFAQIAPGETAEKIAKLIGERQVDRTNISISGSGSGKSTTTMINKDTDKVFWDSELSYELGNRPELGGVVATLINNDSELVYMLLWPYDKTGRVEGGRKAYEEADWVNGGARQDAEDFKYTPMDAQDEELNEGAEWIAKERGLAQEEEFRRAAQSAAVKRLEAILGAEGASRKTDESASGAPKRTEGAWADARAGTATPAGGEAHRRHDMEKAIAAGQIGAAPVERERSDSLLIEVADANHHAEHIAHALGAGAGVQHAIGLVAMAPVIADAIADQTVPEDVIELMRRRQLAKTRKREQGLAIDETN